jgi:hypothetical protein
MADLFNDDPNKTQAPPPAPTLPESSYYDDLVGEGKKFSSTEALARGKHESDLYVAQLQAENAGMRATIAQQESVSDMLDKALDGQAAPQEPATPADTPSDPAASGISPEEIQKLVEAQVNSRLSAEQKKENVLSCHDAAKAAFGEGYVEVLTTKAAELGLDQKFLEGLAADQPTAFKELLVSGAEKTAEGTSPALESTLPASSSVPTVMGAPVKNYAYYELLRKKDKVAYWSAPVQQEIYAAAREQGEDFYK